MNGLSLRFTLFGIPVSIEAFSWILLALLGGAFRISSSADVPPVLLFMVAGMICLIFHEMGHALAGKTLMGGNPYIILGGLGGVTVHPAMRATRWKYFAMVLAGPLAGFLPAIIAVVLMCLFYYSLPGEYLATIISPFGDGYLVAAQVGMNPMVYVFYQNILWIGIVWTILNLLPIYPLDGNKLLGSIINNDYIAAIIGLVASVLFLLFCIDLKSIYMIMLSGYFVYLNYQNFKFIKGSSR